MTHNRKLILSCLLGAFLCLTVLARQLQTPTAVSELDLYKPSPMPDRVVLTWSGDTATTQSVTWRTDTTVGKGLAQFGKADHGPYVEKQAVLEEAKTETISTDLGFQANYHSVTFKNLEPGSQYSYRVGDGVNWSEWYTFKTASRKAEPFKFIYFGDVQNGIKSLWSRVFRRAYLDAPDARFFLYAGDMVNRANKDSEWGELSYGPGWANGTTPSIPVTGNHEYDQGKLSGHWQPSYTLPENGIEGLKESSYYIDYQGVRVIVLNSSDKQAEQTPWLEGVLKNNPNRWTMVAFHHPILSAAEGRDNPELRRLWKPLFDKYRVDMVLQGHDHTYARSNFDKVASSQNQEQSGTMYVVTVCGSKMYNLNRQPWMQRVAEDTQFYQIIQVESDKLKYEARTATGECYDRFELRKRRGHANQLVETGPRSKERLRTKKIPD